MLNAGDGAQSGLPRGCVQVYTGDGKGKTTAALGLALRASGAGLRVFIGQFMKHGETCETGALKRLGERVVCRQYGTGRFVRGAPAVEELEAARLGLADVSAAVREGRFDVVILDEVGVALHFGLFEVGDILEIVASRPPRMELVLTGRRMPPEILERADLVTEMRSVRHYYDAGVAARRGIED